MNEIPFKQVEGGVCAAKGFMANGLNCGLNSDPAKNDLCLVVSDSYCDAAAVYTTNKVKGAPILVTRAHLAMNGGRIRGFIAFEIGYDILDGVTEVMRQSGLSRIGAAKDLGGIDRCVYGTAVS